MFGGPNGNVETLPTDNSNNNNNEEQKPQGKVIPSITPSDEMRLYSDLYNEYGHPVTVRFRVAYAWTLTAWSVYMMVVTTNPVVFCAAAALAGIVSVAYMLTNSGG